MIILAFNAYYEPEKASSMYLSTNLYEDLAKAGIEIELYVPVPTRGVNDNLRNYYKKHKFETKCNGRLRIHRIGIPREKRGVLQRALRYILMNCMFMIKGIAQKADVIYIQSTPPTQGAMAGILKKIKKIPIVYNLQDVFPDSMVSAGLTKEGSLIWKIGRKIEKFSYASADKIIVISDAIKKNIVSKGVDPSKVDIIPNWVDTDIVQPVIRENNDLFDKYHIDRNKFIVLYAGNIGHAQNFRVIINAARILKDEKDILFIIFGNGECLDECKTMIQNGGLEEKVYIFPLLSYEKVPFVYSVGNCGIVSCKPGFGKSALPSKMWSIMSTGRAVLANFDCGTEVQSIIEDNEVGLFTEADNDLDFAEAILSLYKDRIRCDEMGKRGRIYVEKNLSRNKGTDQYGKVFRKVVR